MTRSRLPWIVLVTFVSLLLPQRLLRAQTDARPLPEAPQAAPAPTDPGWVKGVPANASASNRPVTVAVLDFNAEGIAIDDLGAIIGETVAVMLAGQPGFDTVDRASIQRTLAEHELNLSGLVDTAQAVQVGKLVGARILITGRAFQLGQRTFITAKLIGTETSLVDGVLVKGDQGAGIDDLVIDLSQRLIERLPGSAPRLVAADAPRDPLPALREALAARVRPTLAVVIAEDHLHEATRREGRQAGGIPDPAAETEVKRLFRAAGFEVQDVSANALADWVRAARKGQPHPWPQDVAAADLVITGEALSEAAGQLGKLQSATARVEINLIERRSGKILLAERATTRAVDLAGAIAAKTALEKGGRIVGLEALRHLAEHLPTKP